MTDEADRKEIRRVSEKDREYFRRLGEWEAENKHMEVAEHAARTPRERLIHSLRIAQVSVSIDHGGPRGDTPLGLYAEAVRRGLARR